MDETHYWSKIIYFSNKQNNKLLKLRRFLLSKSKLLKHDRFFVWLGPSQGESLIVVLKFYLNIKCQFNIKLTISGNPEDVCGMENSRILCGVKTLDNQRIRRNKCHAWRGRYLKKLPRVSFLFLFDCGFSFCFHGYLFVILFKGCYCRFMLYCSS